MTPHQKKELRHFYEVFALLAELGGQPEDAKCIRQNSENLIESMSLVETQAPGFVEVVLMEYRRDTWKIPADGLSG